MNWKNRFEKKVKLVGFDSVIDRSPEFQQFPLGRLQEYAILGLFGNPLHEFRLANDGPTILTGVNGTGKSTILRTISAISKGSWWDLIAMDFTGIHLAFESGSLEVNKIHESRIEVILVSSGRNLRWISPKRSLPERWQEVSDIDAKSLHLAIQGLDEISRSDLTSFARYLAAGKGSPDEIPDWLASLTQEFPTLLISDQRLMLHRPKGRVAKEGSAATLAIEEAVEDIASEVQKYKSIYATVSQKLDRDFPRRVLEAMNSERSFLSISSVRRSFKELNSLRKSLATAGLIDAAELDDSIAGLPVGQSAELAVISTYLRDTRDKLNTFDPLRRRLELFIDFLRRHYRGKAIYVNELGLLTVATQETGESIPLTALSSGEQQIFVLAHKILFRTQPGTLVMIDEPELSLHVLWQSTFIDDLTAMSDISGSYFLLATHSPTIIAGRKDLRRSLDS